MFYGLPVGTYALVRGAATPPPRRALRPGRHGAAVVLLVLLLLCLALGPTLLSLRLQPLMAATPCVHVGPATAHTSSSEAGSPVVQPVADPRNDAPAVEHGGSATVTGGASHPADHAGATAARPHALGSVTEAQSRAAQQLQVRMAAVAAAAAANLTFRPGVALLGGPGGMGSVEPAPVSELLAPRAHEAVDPASYIVPSSVKDMRDQHEKVSAYLRSEAFAKRSAERAARRRRGIIINAGGRVYLSSAVVQLKVLRDVLHCTLPVELVWQGAEEMDAETLSMLQRRFGPLRGYDISAMPYPEHHRQTALTRYVGKVFSLLHSEFSEALLLDADNVPLANPEALFDLPLYRTSGNLFWPDYSSARWSRVSSVVAGAQNLYRMVGLRYETARAVLDGGRRSLNRDTESGQLLVDLARHADVIEYLAWINSFSEKVYKSVWGDKDTFGVAFAVAGKAQAFTQLEVPPGALLSWQEGKLLVKATQEVRAGWMLIGMLQFDPQGKPAFMHRTINKFRVDGTPTPIGLITGPLPTWWVRYYLSHEALGPTQGVPWDYVAPDTAFQEFSLAPAMCIPRTAADGRAWELAAEEACPAALFATYRAMREHGLPVGANATLDAACAHLLPALWGARARAFGAAGFGDAAEAANLWREAAAGGFDRAARWRNALEVPQAAPVVAWRPDYMAPMVETPTAAAIRAAYEAVDWVKGHQALFPRIRDGP